MPKRILDGEALWGSHKIASMEPAWVRAEYPWWHSLAGANGVFELDLRAIWAKCYAYARPDKSLEDLRTIRDAFVQAKLLFTWEQDGKTWAYWVGSDKPGLLPRKSWRDREAKNGKLAPEPPGEELRRFLGSTDDPQQALALQPARDCRAADTPEACNLHGSSVPGFGSGFGSGSGTGNGSCASHTPAPAALGVCEQILAIWNVEKGPLAKVKALTPSRCRKILARLRSDPNFLGTFTAAVQKARATPFLAGAGDQGWRASFDWLIENDTNALAVLEGKYDNANGGGGPNGSSRRDRKASGAVVAADEKYDLLPIHRVPN